MSAEPSDEPGAECGLGTGSVNIVRVRKADLSGLQGRGAPSHLRKDCRASLPCAGRCSLGILPGAPS